MFVSRIRLQNWKNFVDCDVMLRRRAFLVGPNASGKSNFLDALRFLHDIAASGGGLDTAVAARGGVKKLRSLAARRKNDIQLHVELSDDDSMEPIWAYTLAFGQEATGNHRTVIVQETVTRQGEAILNRPDSEDEADPLRLTQTYLEQINANKDFREISNYFSTLSYVHLIPQVIRQPDSFSSSGSRPEEDSFGFYFLERVSKTPKPTREARLRRIEEALRIAVPQLKNLSLTRDAMGVPHLEVIYEHWRPNAGRQQEYQFSDGTIRLIGFLWAVLDATSLLLLEEPELSLHPAIVRELPAILYRLNRSKKRPIQSIVSTHSPDLLSDKSVAAEEIVLFVPETEGTRTVLATAFPDVVALLAAGLSPGEVVIPRSVPEDVDQLSLFANE
jgi:predicted ATPase